MNLSGIISISGFAGLFKIVAQSKNGVIVESLITKKRMPAYSNFKISALEDISIFGKSDDVLLSEILKKIATTNNKEALKTVLKTETELINFMLEVFPDFDSERVHASDIKKIVAWYEILQKNGLLAEEEVSETIEPKEVIEKAAKTKEKVTKATAATKAAPKSAGKISASKAPKTSTIRKTGA